MSHRLRRSALAFVGLLFVTACSSGPDSSSADRTQRAAPSETAHANESTAEHPTFAHDLETSEVLSPGHGLEILRTLPTDSGESAVLGVLRDGRLLVRDGSALQLETPDGGMVTPIQTPSPDAALGVFDFDDNGRHLVWVTTTASDYFTFPWRMYSLDLESGVVREIARHRDVGVDPVPVVPDGTSPRLLDGRAYYAAVHKVKDNGTVVPAVYSVPADGGAPPRMEVKDAYAAMTLGRRLVYVRSAFGFVKWELHSRVPGRPGSDKVIASGRGKGFRFSGVASDGVTLMWQAKEGRMCALNFVSRTSEPLTLGPDRCGPVWSGYHHIGGDWTAFSTGSSPYQTYVVRTFDGTLYRLTTGPTLGASYGRGDIITWRPARGPDKGKTIVARMTLE